ncbi:MAG: formimidoylglutamase [Chitinophagales bacterium]|nr:formimidoylglutamase [Chitinophagales bacterium]
MFYEFLSPADVELIVGDEQFQLNQIGNHIKYFTGEAIDLQEFNMAIVGVTDGRGDVENEGCAGAPNEVRKQLLKLFIPSKNQFKVIDLGNIIAGETARDTYFALASVVLKCITHKVVPIILGGSHDISFGQFLGYQDLQGMINVANIDARIDMGATPDAPLSASSFLMHLLMHQPNILFNYSQLGHQSYMNDPNAVDTLESLGFDCFRLGMMQSNIELAEPIVRDADMVSIDISCVRMSDAPAHAQASPHGFYGEELCQITRYAGMSDRVSSIGFYGMNPHYDINQQSAQLYAHAVWYFMEGYYCRKNDIPVENSNYLCFKVNLGVTDHEIVFWKSNLTDRWWMELPFKNTKYSREQLLVPCTYADYQMACNDEVPDKFMKYYTRML